jgi:hypothetical protein
MMVSNILLGFIILTLFIYVIIMCANNKFNSNDCTLIGIALILLLTIYITYMQKVKYNNQKKVEETFEGAPLNYKMGKFTGLNPLKDDMPYNNLTPKDLLEQSNTIYHSPVGTPHSLLPDPAVACNYPSVDGTNSGLKAMAMLAYNHSSPDCCPSTYSNSMGCICLSEEQQKYLGRGGSVIDS